MTNLKADWYPDPSGDPTKLRYFDGTQWTEHFADALPTGTPPQKKSKTLLFVLIGVGALLIIGAIVAIALTQCSTEHPISDQNISTNQSQNNNSADAANPITGGNSNNGSSNNNNNVEMPETPELAPEVVGQVGTQYDVFRRSFTVNSLQVTSSYGGITAASGNSLVVFNVTTTNTHDKPEPFGAYDWFMVDENVFEAVFPLDPVSENMMPSSGTLEPGQTATYDVVIEFPSNLASPYILYFDSDYEGTIFRIIKFDVK